MASTERSMLMSRRNNRMFLCCWGFLLLLLIILQIITRSCGAVFTDAAPPQTSFSTTSFFHERISRATVAFCPVISSQQRKPTTSPLLWAKKVKKKKPNNKNVAASTGSGFGASTTPSSTTEASSSSTTSIGTGAKALRKAANNYDDIRKRDGLKACRDVYVRSPLNNPSLFWFVGKIARALPVLPASSSSSEREKDDKESSDNSSQEGKEEECCCAPFFTEAALFQKRLILDYSKTKLRPQNFGGKKYASTLELWLAPADSEMNVATNKVSLCGPIRKLLDAATITASDDDLAVAAPAPVSSTTVGYNPEIYIGDEIAKGGLRVERDENGNPTKAAFDVNESM